MSNRGKEKKTKRGVKRIKNEGKYTYLVFLFSIGPYDQLKKSAKTETNFKQFRGGGEIFRVALLYTPLVKLSELKL